MFKQSFSPLPSGPHSFGAFRTPRVFFDTPTDTGEPGGTAVLSNAPEGAGDPALKELDLAHASPEQKQQLAGLTKSLGSLVERINVALQEKETPANADGSVTALIEKQARELEQLKAEVERQQRDIRARNSVSGIEHAMGNDDPAKNFDVIRAMVGAYHGWGGPSAQFPEKDICFEYMRSKDVPLEYRDTIHDTTSASRLAVLIPPVVMQDFIERLSAATVALNAGAQFLSDLAGAPVEMPRVQGGLSAEWLGETTAPTDSQVSTGMLRLIPKELAVSATVSRKLMALSGDASRRLIEQDMQRVMGETLDTGVIRGGGGSATPLGIANTPGIGTTDVTAGGVYGALALSGASQNVTDYLNLTVAKCDARNALGDRNAFACNPLALQQLRTAKDTEGKPLLHTTMGSTQFGDASALTQRNTATGARGELWGHPVYTSTNLLYGTVTDLMFGNWSDVLIGGWGPLLLEMSTDHDQNFKRRLVTLMMHQMVDAGLRHPEAFELWTGWSNTAISL